MAIAKLNAMYEFVKGAATKPKKKDGHSHGTYQVLTHREAATTNPNCQRVYIKPADAYQRTTAPGADEIAARTRFGTVRGMVETRRKDLTKITADRAAWLAQKDEPGGKKTLMSWYWMVCGQEYDQNQG